MAHHLITVDKNTYESLQQELIEIRQVVARLEQAQSSTIPKYSQEQMGLLIDNTPAAIAIFDRQMHYLLASRRWREDYNLGDRNIIGCSHYDIFPEISSDWREIHQRCLAGAVEKSQEETFLRANGTIDWIKWEINPWYEDSGEIGGIIIFTQVITALKQAEAELKRLNSDRKQTEQKLQEQAQFLQSIWKGVDYGIYVLDILDDGAEFRFVKFNPAILSMSPVPLEPFLGKTIAEALAADMAHQYRQRYKKCIKLGKSIFFEESFWANDKETCWLLNIMLLLHSASRISQLMVTVTDITERKQAEQERQTFVSLIENSSDFIGFGNINGQPIFVNEAGRKLVGIENLETLENISILDFFLPKDREDLQQRILPSVIERGLWQGEHCFRHFETEEVIPVDYNMFVIKRTETGEPLYMATITRDIRERKQAEEALKASQHFIQRITDSSPNILYIFDLEEQRNVYANHEIAKILGYSHEAIQRMGTQILLKITHPDDWEKVVIHLQNFLIAKDGDIFDLEFRVRQANGEWRWLYSRETPFNRAEDGKIKQILGVSTDITERKQAEIQLQQ
nr:PAS domain S-box protein [Atlanticothrix silvestris]